MIITELSAGPELDELAARASAITAAASQARVGNGALTWQPAEIAADLRHQVPSVLHRWLLLSDGDHDLAAITMEANTDTDGPPDSELWLPPGTDPARVMPRFVAISRDFASSLGRRTFCAWHLHDERTDRLASPVGIGSIGRDQVAELLLAAGARLAQVYRISALELVDEPIAAPLAEGRQPAGYRLVSWFGSTPEKWLPQVAAMHSVTMADAPSGETGYVPEQFSVERVAADEAMAVASGRELVSVLGLASDGQPAGLTQIAVQVGAELAYQWDTVVVPEQRGHGLGRALKMANAALVRTQHPQVRRVITFNAAENTHMLRINEELGWAPIAHKGVWVLPATAEQNPS